MSMLSMQTITNKPMYTSTDSSLTNSIYSNVVYSHDFLRNAFVFMKSNWDDIFVVLFTLCVSVLFISYYKTNDIYKNIHTITQTITYNGRNTIPYKSSKNKIENNPIFQTTQGISPDTTYFQYSN